MARTVLTTDTNFYVRSDGNDSNDGSANDAAHAWLTLQNAYDFLDQNCDFMGCKATVRVDDGSYDGLVVYNHPLGGYASNISPIHFVGNLTAPSNVIINNASQPSCFLATWGKIVIDGGFKLVSSNDGLYASAGGSISMVGPMDFGACNGYHMHANVGGTIVVATPSYNISGSAAAHYYAEKSGVIEVNSTSVSLSGTPNFGLGFALANFGYLIHDSASFSGSATGSRYVAMRNGVIDSGGHGTSYFPGNAVGSTNSGGVYI